MSESAVHLSLVERLVKWIRDEQRDVENALLLVDLPHTPAGDKPPQIGGFNPDVFCATLDRRHVIVGEAKTPTDIETRHSREQFGAFLAYLQHQQRGTLVVAVPWHAVNQAKSLVRALQRNIGADGVVTVFLQQLPG